MLKEEAKLENLRSKIADHELQIVRGQLPADEGDLDATLPPFDERASDDSDGSMRRGVYTLWQCDCACGAVACKLPRA